MILFLSPHDFNNQETMSSQLFKNRGFLNACMAWMDEHIEAKYDKFLLLDRNETYAFTPKDHFQHFSVRTCIFPNEHTGIRRIVYLSPPKS